MRPELTNQQRPFLGLRPVLARWQREEWSPNTVIFRDEQAIRKVITHLTSAGPNALTEVDYDIFLTADGLLKTVSGRGKPRLPTLSNLEKYRPTGYSFYFNGATRFSTSARGHTILPLKAHGPFSTWAAVVQWLDAFIARQAVDYPQRLAAQLLAPTPKLSYRPGDVVAFLLDNDAGYGFYRVLLDVNRLRKTPWVQDPPTDTGSWHYLKRIIGPLALVEVLKIRKASPSLTRAELEATKRYPCLLLGDDYIKAGSHPIIAYQQVEAGQVQQLPQSFEQLLQDGLKGYMYQWGLATVVLPDDEELTQLYEFYSKDIVQRVCPLADIDTESLFYNEPRAYQFEDGQEELERYDVRHSRFEPLRAAVMARLGLPATTSYDEFSQHLKLPTRQELVDWQTTLPPSDDNWQWWRSKNRADVA